MRILVTGADGFIGSHLVELLLAKGHHVRALSFYNSFNYWGWLEDLPHHKNLEILSGDIRDPFFCNMITKDQEAVFHLAALIAIPYSYNAPSSYIETNVTGTLNMCQAALQNNVKRFIQTSTSEVYGTAKVVPINEEHPLQPQSPYSASKISADALCMSYHYSFNLPVTVARPFNTYGPRQSARAIIPTIITQIASGADKLRLGDLRPTRDLNFVKDTCMGFLAILESEKTIGETINICSQFEISVGELAQLIMSVMGKKINIVQDEERIRPKYSEVHRLFGDQSKLKRLTGYTPETKLEYGIEQTIKWFKDPKNLAKFKSGIYNK
jgi:NAD dependent epimerase/dehydratase